MAKRGSITGGLGSIIKDTTNNTMNKYKDTGTTGNTSGGSGGGSGGSGGGSSSYSNQLKQQQAAAAYKEYLAEIQRRQQQAADDAYNRNVSAMNDAFNQRGDLLKSNLDSALKNLETDYNASRDAINRDATEAAREAYINRMMSQRNLAQNMAAQGLSGGASETTLAGLENSYGNARNQIATTANENLGDLEDLYSKNRNSAWQSYNDQLAADALQRAQYMTQFENDRQNLLAQAYDNQLSQLMNLDPSFVAAMSGAVSSQAGYTPVNQAEAGNTAPVVSTTQGSGGTGVMNSWYANRARQLRASGASDAEIAQELANEGIANSGIQYILNQLY